MTFDEIYNATTKYYPSEIDISDGKSIDKDGGYFKKLSEIWDIAEIKTENESEYIQLMVWAIFCAYHKKAVENFLSKNRKVYLSELDINYMRYKFEESLFSEGFNHLKGEYELEK